MTKTKTTKVQRLKAKITGLAAEIREEQNACLHPPVHVQYKYGANTGNWDRHDDCYWTDIYCGLCQKRWTVNDSANIDGRKVVNFSYDLD